MERAEGEGQTYLKTNDKFSSKFMYFFWFPRRSMQFNPFYTGNP